MILIWESYSWLWCVTVLGTVTAAERLMFLTKHNRVMGEMKETHCWEHCNSATPIKHLLCLLLKLKLSVKVLILRKKVGTLIWSRTTFCWPAGQDLSRTFPCAAIIRCDFWKIKGISFHTKGDSNSIYCPSPLHSLHIKCFSLSSSA